MHIFTFVSKTTEERGTASNYMYLHLKRAVPQNFRNPSTEGIGISWRGVGVVLQYKTKKLKETFEALLEFLEGLGKGDVRKNPFCGGSMDIF